jgi:transposase
VSTMKKVDAIKMERSAPTRRIKRRHSAEFKARVLSECAARGASVAGVALAHGVNANLVRKWIVAKHRALAPTVSTTALLPVRVTTEEAAVVTIPNRSGVGRPSEAIEIEIAGARIRVRADFDANVLGAVLRVVRDSLSR